MSERDLRGLTDRIMAYDYGDALSTGSGWVSDFGQDAGFLHAPAAYAPPAAHSATLHPREAFAARAPPPSRSVLLDFLFQTLAVVTGTYVVQRFIVPRPPHPRGGGGHAG
jgi:hypothetical protein